MSIHFQRVRYRAHGADEDVTFDDGSGPPPPPPPPGTVPSAITDGLFVDTVFGQLIWETYNDSELGPYTDPSPDTWHHVQWAETFHDGATIVVDDAVTVDGALLFTRSGQDSFVAGFPTAALFGDDGTAGVGGVFYLDDCSIDGVLIDDFEGGSLAAWDTAPGVSISTDQAHSGTHSLKVTSVPGTPAYLRKNIAVADGDTRTLECWVYLPSAYTTALLGSASTDLLAFVQF